MLPEQFKIVVYCSHCNAPFILAVPDDFRAGCILKLDWQDFLIGVEKQKVCQNCKQPLKTSHLL